MCRPPLLAFHVRVLDAHLHARARADLPEVACRLFFVLRRVGDELLCLLFPFVRIRFIGMRLVEAFFALGDVALGFLFVLLDFAFVGASLSFGFLGVPPRVLEFFEVRLRLIERGFGVVERCGDFVESGRYGVSIRRSFFSDTAGVFCCAMGCRVFICEADGFRQTVLLIADFGEGFLYGSFAVRGLLIGTACTRITFGSRVDLRFKAGLLRRQLVNHGLPRVEFLQVVVGRLLRRDGLARPLGADGAGIPQVFLGLRERLLAVCEILRRIGDGGLCIGDSSRRIGEVMACVRERLACRLEILPRRLRVPDLIALVAQARELARDVVHRIVVACRRRAQEAREAGRGERCRHGRLPREMRARFFEQIGAARAPVLAAAVRIAARRHRSAFAGRFVARLRGSGRFCRPLGFRACLRFFFCAFFRDAARPLSRKSHDLSPPFCFIFSSASRSRSMTWPPESRRASFVSGPSAAR